MHPDIRDRLQEAALRPSFDLDVEALHRKAQRTRMRHIVLAAGLSTISIVVTAAVVLSVWEMGDPVPPVIAPPADEETPEPPDEDDATAAGWQDLSAGDLTVTVPTDWTIITVEEPQGSGDGVESAGPCPYDLHGGLEDRRIDDGPLAYVIPDPTDGGCRTIEMAAPPHPGVLLHAGLGEHGDAGELRVRAERDGVRDRIGTVEVWRVTDDWLTRFVPVDPDVRGGLWVSHLDDPVVQEILDSVRLTDQPGPVEVDEHPPSMVDEFGTITPDRLDQPVIVSGDDGIYRFEAGGEELMWDGPAVAALPDLRGGIVFHEPAEQYDELWGFGTIRWLPAGADTPADPPIAGEDERAVLQAVVEWNDEPTVLFTRRAGDLDGPDREGQEERLYAFGLDSGTEVDLGVTGRLESGLDGAVLVDGRLVLSRCHLDCWIDLLPADGTTEDEAEDVERFGSHGGLDTAAGVVAWVTVASTEEQHGTLTLVLLDVAAHLEGRDDARREIELLTIPQPSHMIGVSTLDLDPELRAALVSVHWYDTDQDTSREEIFHIDQLDTDPRVHRVQVEGHVRFDHR